MLMLKSTHNDIIQNFKEDKEIAMGILIKEQEELRAHHDAKDELQVEAELKVHELEEKIKTLESIYSKSFKNQDAQHYEDVTAMADYMFMLETIIHTLGNNVELRSNANLKSKLDAVEFERMNEIIMAVKPVKQIVGVGLSDESEDEGKSQNLEQEIPVGEGKSFPAMTHEEFERMNATREVLDNATKLDDGTIHSDPNNNPATKEYVENNLGTEV